MAQIFPKWTNKAPLYVLAGVVLALILITGLIWYYGSPWYTDVGYRPQQPVPYSHKLHAGDLGLDCRFCHTGVETSPVAGIPPTQTCMNCHNMIKTESEQLALIRDSFKNNTHMQWIPPLSGSHHIYVECGRVCGCIIVQK